MGRAWRIEFEGALYHILSRGNKWEDLRHGMILGTKKFVNKIRSTYLPEKPHKEIPQQRDLAGGTNPIVLLNEAAQILDCDLNHFK